jgi:prepilin-type N-terminal cleavage/methylation domain-containing protein
MFNWNSGFSLVETMVAIAISTGTALAVYKFIGESQKGQVIVENRDEINQIHREVVGKFTDRGICTRTLSPYFAQNKKAPFRITEIVNSNGFSSLVFPHKRGRVSIFAMAVSKVEKDKNQAQIMAIYKSGVAGKITEFKKVFTIELSYKGDQFEGCITRGNLGLDPKDACDLVVGLPDSGESYFYNGKCHFAKAACEQSGRTWNEQKLKCDFSDEDLKAMRRETCDLFNMRFAENERKCIASEQMVNAFNEMKKMIEEKARNDK